MNGIKRDSLKSLFRSGQMPTEKDFSTLIDSMVNQIDEGFDKTEKDGLRISQIGTGKLMSFYENLSVNSPQWFLEMGPKLFGERSLHVVAQGASSPASVLSLVRRTGAEAAQRGAPVAVGVNKRDPRHELDVGGNVRSRGRLGCEGELVIKANGEWQSITKPMSGCNALEIVAGAGAKDDEEGKYAIVHAVAVNAFGGKGSITMTQSNYGSGCSRLLMRWLTVDKSDKFQYVLQMRSHCTYGPEAWIRYHITELWFDPLMYECAKPPVAEAPR